ncbi:MAG: Two component transcriptional regulator, LytTR family [Gemmatimonadetes bacterium]|nr:Two component transcriptional regulator, LytTR family [Gemmatimonadota bacterium]
MSRPPDTRETPTKLRVVVADDERPARRFLVNLLMGAPDVVVVGEAADGADAVALIERERPDLALLDLEMPVTDGLGVVRLLRKDSLPLVAFVTAYDAYAIQAFELNAIDYLLKPVDATRLRHTLTRAHDRLERADWRESEAVRLAATAELVTTARSAAPLERIPVRRRDDVVLVPVAAILSIIADGELLHLTTNGGERHTITYRLKDLEARVPAGQFIRLSRGTLARVDAIAKVSPMPGGTYMVTLSDGQHLPVSRLRSRVVRDSLLKF